MLYALCNIICNEKLIYTLLTLFLSVFVFVKYSYGYWQRRNIYSPPFTSWLGHVVSRLSENSLGIVYAQLYKENNEKPLIGIYITIIKQLVINDLDLIKNILQKDYSFFEGHGFKTNKKYDPMNQNLFHLEGEAWRKIRVKLTPTFTSSKMKYMFDTIYASNEVMVDYLKDHVKHNEDVEVKEIAARLGIDVISSCAFGIESNTFKVPDSKFRRIGKKVFETKVWTSLYDMVGLVAPWLTSRLPISRTTEGVAEFFTGLVEETIAYREKNKIVRNDFLQLLIEMKNAKEDSASHLTLEEIIPQVFVFYAAGFDTSSTTIQFALLELAKNPEIRDALVKKIDTALLENDGKITYELINKMQCLNEVVNETLRMYPPVTILSRTCTKDYKVPNMDCTIEKGTSIVIPIYGIHHDSKHFPEPEKFNPDRFNAEHQSSRHAFAHIPFGEGPRICIGSRFAMLQSKLALLVILQNFHIDLSPKTKLPLKFDKSNFFLQTEEEIVLKLSARQ